MARLILSFGMFSAFAAAIAVRSRGLPSGSPPPALAAMVISLIRVVKIFPRLASAAPFLCLIVAHFEWPDMGTSEAMFWGICADFGLKTRSFCHVPQTPDCNMRRQRLAGGPIGGQSAFRR